MFHDEKRIEAGFGPTWRLDFTQNRARPFVSSTFLTFALQSSRVDARKNCNPPIRFAVELRKSPMKPFFLLFGVCIGAALPLAAQNASVKSPTPATGERGVSLGALLQLTPAQSRQLERISAQSSESNGAKSESDRAAARAALREKGREVLSPVQRSVLDSLARDSRFQIRRDALYSLFMEVPPISAAAEAQFNDAQARRNWEEARRLDRASRLKNARGIGSYGIYGGLDRGGPQAGVYGGYGRGGVGVYGGVGTRGPSIGVNVGRVFGLGRR